MPIYRLKLIDRHEIALHTWRFDFEKPEGFQFKPGQYGGFTLIDPPETDTGGITRRFSLLSAPHDKHLTIAMRIQQSAFKRVLKDLPINSEVKFAGPTGNFILHEDNNVPAVFLAGGIGITPFYSIIKHTAQHLPQQTITLFYGNQQICDAAFLDELSTLSKQYANFTFVPLMADAGEDWTGERGYITDSVIRKYVSDLAAPIYYVCGSPVMVTAVQELLVEMDVDDSRIKTEDFPGY